MQLLEKIYDRKEPLTPKESRTLNRALLEAIHPEGFLPGRVEELYNREDLKALGSLCKTAEETLLAFSFR